MLILIASLVGCADYTTVEDACPGEVPNMEDVDDAFSVDFAVRGACYRKMVGLSPPAVDADVQRAVAGHVAYIAANPLPVDEEGYLVGDWTTESENAAYYGETVFDRLDAAGLPFQLSSIGIWEILAPLGPDETAEQAVDKLMTYPEFHDVFFQHAWSGAGFARGEDPGYGPYVYGVVVYDFPALDNRSWVTWPTDKQEDAPITGAEGLLGPAFSIVVGGSSDAASFDAVNPYALSFIRTPVLTGPDGAVGLSWTEPGDIGGFLPRAAMIGYADEALAPDTEYTLVGEIAYSEGTQDIDVKFTTAAGAAEPAARVTPGAARVQHHRPGALR